MDFDCYEENGTHIQGTDDGWLFVNGECVNEPGTDEQFDKYAVDVMNGNGYYDENGKFVRTGWGGLMDFNVTELDLLCDAVNKRIHTLHGWQQKLYIMNADWLKAGNMDEEIQDNIDAIQDYQNQIDRLEPLLAKLSDALFTLVNSPTA